MYPCCSFTYYALHLPSLWQSLNVPNSLTQTGAVYGLSRLCAAAQNHPRSEEGKQLLQVSRYKFWSGFFLLVCYVYLCILKYTYYFNGFVSSKCLFMFVLDKSILATYTDDALWLQQLLSSPLILFDNEPPVFAKLIVQSLPNLQNLPQCIRVQAVKHSATWHDQFHSRGLVSVWEARIWPGVAVGAIDLAIKWLETSWNPTRNEAKMNDISTVGGTSPSNPMVCYPASYILRQCSEQSPTMVRIWPTMFQIYPANCWSSFSNYVLLVDYNGNNDL